VVEEAQEQSSKAYHHENYLSPDGDYKKDKLITIP